jgi:hypothetical protein
MQPSMKSVQATSKPTDPDYTLFCDEPVFRHPHHTMHSCPQNQDPDTQMDTP